MAYSVPETLYVYECRGPESPVREPAGEGYLGIWPEIPFYYLFYECRAHWEVFSWLQENGPGWTLSNTYQLEYSQWQQVATRGQSVGPFLIQTVFGSEIIDTGEGLPILLNPGLVFGSGLHETTRGCLLAIADLFDRYPVASVVDLGTGTGILALACARLGAAAVRAVDCVPLAARVARNNVLVNDQQRIIDVLVAQHLGVFRQGSDLLLMNLEWPCLCQVLAEKQWLDYRWMVMSGFLRSRLPAVLELIAEQTEILFEKELNGWITLVLGHS